METISFPTYPATSKIINTANSVNTIPTNKPSHVKYANHFINSRNRNTQHFLIFCSTNSHTDTHSDVQKTNQKSHSTPSHNGLVFGLGSPGSWDSSEVSSPVVKRFLSDDEERWYMWYYGKPDTGTSQGSIGLATSSNGMHWQRGLKADGSRSGVGLVMSCGENWWAFDTLSIRPSEVMVMSSSKLATSGVYWLYYTGYTSEEVALPETVQLGAEGGMTVYKSLPGLAISQDGRNWARIEGDHHSGALFDVGSSGEWDSLFIASPHVVYHNTADLRMYYHSFDPKEGKFAIGLARSRDGIKWLKQGKVIEGGVTSGCFDEMGVMNACVVVDKKVGNYVMAYEGVAADGKRSIGVAVSPDGLKEWKRVSAGPVLVPSPNDGWDNKGVCSPCLVQMDGEEDKWRLYYTGVGVDGKTGIGLALSQGTDATSFRRWAGLPL